MCTASCILKSMLCLKRTKATPTAAQATRKSLKKISRENQCFNSNFISSFTGLNSLQVSFAYSGRATTILTILYLTSLKGKMRKKDSKMQKYKDEN